MEPDDRTELKSWITTSHPFSTKPRMRVRLGLARSHITASPAAVSEDRSLKRKGLPR